MKPLILILALTLSLAAQKLPKNIEREYDRFKDETTISAPLELDRSAKTKWQTGGWYQAELLFTYPGKELPSDVREFSFWISDECGDRYCFHGPSIIFLLDGKRFDIAYRPTSDLGSDIASFELTRDELKKLSEAQTLEFQVEYSEGRFKPKDIETLKAILDLGTKH